MQRQKNTLQAWHSGKTEKNGLKVDLKLTPAVLAGRCYFIYYRMRNLFTTSSYFNRDF